MTVPPRCSNNPPHPPSTVTIDVRLAARTVEQLQLAADLLGSDRPLPRSEVVRRGRAVLRVWRIPRAEVSRANGAATACDWRLLVAHCEPQAGTSRRLL